MKKRPHLPLLIAVCSLAFNAHALCMNPDGSLDDASVSASTIAMDVLPACGNPASSTIHKHAFESGAMTPNSPEPVEAKTKAKGYDKSALNRGDCQTANGESKMGFLGVPEMLPKCSF
jgi:hypothetical protein